MVHLKGLILINKIHSFNTNQLDAIIFVQHTDIYLTFLINMYRLMDIQDKKKIVNNKSLNHLKISHGLECMIKTSLSL